MLHERDGVVLCRSFFFFFEIIKNSYAVVINNTPCTHHPVSLNGDVLHRCSTISPPGN